MSDSKTLKNQSLRRRLGFALAGLWYAVQTERSLQIHMCALGIVVAGLAILRPGALWTALVLLAAGGVIAAELMNTALEALADLVHPEQHPQIRIVKDCAAAAVLIASAAAVGVALALVLHLVL